MDKITINVQDLSKVSDGYHTISELYDHRCLLFINFFKAASPYCHIKKDHYEGWDALLIQTPVGQISYHVPIKYRYLYEKDKTTHIEFDGHTSKDVIDRLIKLAEYHGANNS